MSGAKPVDLAAIRARIASTQGSGNAVNAILYHDAPAMAVEIEALREALRTIDRLARDRSAVIDGRFDAELTRAFALLPPS